MINHDKEQPTMQTETDLEKIVDDWLDGTWTPEDGEIQGAIEERHFAGETFEVVNRETLLNCVKKFKSSWLSQLRKEIEGLDFSDVKIVANKKGDELHPNAQSHLDGYFEAVHDVLNLPSLQEA